MYKNNIIIITINKKTILKVAPGTCLPSALTGCSPRHLEQIATNRFLVKVFVHHETALVLI